MTLTPKCVAIIEQGLGIARLDKGFCKASEIVRLKDERLLAAAPDLLAACKAMLLYMPNYDGEVPCDSGLGTMEQAEAAIAKAEEE